MSKAGGSRPGAGRPRGSVNQRHGVGLADSIGAGTMPAEYLSAIMRDASADERRRDWAAEKLMPFLYPRPAPTPRLVRIALPDTSTVEGIKAALAALTQAAASGQIAPSEAQSMAGLIEGQRKAIESEDLLRRLEALEAASR